MFLPHRLLQAPYERATWKSSTVDQISSGSMAKFERQL